MVVPTIHWRREGKGADAPFIPSSILIPWWSWVKSHAILSMGESVNVPLVFIVDTHFLHSFLLSISQSSRVRLRLQQVFAIIIAVMKRAIMMSILPTITENNMGTAYVGALHIPCFKTFQKRPKNRKTDLHIRSLQFRYGTGIASSYKISRVQVTL